jgi:hypothetical protein
MFCPYYHTYSPSYFLPLYFVKREKGKYSIISFYLISIYITNRILIIYYKIAPPSLRSREGGRGMST